MHPWSIICMHSRWRYTAPSLNRLLKEGFSLHVVWLSVYWVSLIFARFWVKSGCKAINSWLLFVVRCTSLHKLHQQEMLRKRPRRGEKFGQKGWGPTRCLDAWSRQKEGKDEAPWPNQSFETSFQNGLKRAHCLMTLVSLERNFITAEANLYLHFCHNKCTSLQPLKPERRT